MSQGTRHLPSLTPRQQAIFFSALSGGNSLPQTFGSRPDPDKNSGRAVRAWSILHAYGSVDRSHSLITGQLSLGMRPSLVTLEGPGLTLEPVAETKPENSSISLLTAWNDVRHWRRVLMESDPAGESDIVHAHCFTGGMAGVRNFPAVVYDVDRWVEDTAADPRDSEHSWLSRSFRVAEQFVLARAAAVVTRCRSMREASVQRGASVENVFVIPEAVEPADPAPCDHDFLQSLGIAVQRAIVLYAPDHRIELGEDQKLSAAAEFIIAALAIIASEVDDCYLLVEVADDAQPAFRDAVDAYGTGSVIKHVSSGDRSRALASCDVVIAGSTAQFGSSTAANPSAIDAFAARRALLAADLLCNRDLSANGRGCLWFGATDPRDLAHRATFLARNPEFRRALADAGYGYYLETRSSIAVAQQYDIVYRHAFARRKSGNLQTPAIRLLPLQASF